MSRRGISIALTSLFLLSTGVSVIAQKAKNQQKIEDPLKVNVTGKDAKADNKTKAEAKKSRDQENASKALLRGVDEDVQYIITGEERAGWKRLKTDEEREQFIEQFWLRPDPTPDTI